MAAIFIRDVTSPDSDEWTSPEQSNTSSAATSTTDLSTHSLSGHVSIAIPQPVNTNAGQSSQKIEKDDDHLPKSSLYEPGFSVAETLATGFLSSPMEGQFHSSRITNHDISRVEIMAQKRITSSKKASVFRERVAKASALVPPEIPFRLFKYVSLNKSRALLKVLQTCI